MRTIIVACSAALFFLPAPISASPFLVEVQMEKDAAQTQMVLRADELVEDDLNNRVVIRGDVKFAYKGYTLTADKLIYEHGSNSLQAIGNVRVEEPDGARITAQRITFTNDLGDGFLRSFKSRGAAATTFKFKRF